MRIQNIVNNSYSKIGYTGNLTKAAIISAMMTTPAAHAEELKADTFEIVPKTEYVQDFKTYSHDSTYFAKDSVVDKKARGNEFNNWFLGILSATDENGNIDMDKLNATPLNFALKDDESYLDLAESIVASFDKNNNGEVSFYEFETKSKQDIAKSDSTMADGCQKSMYSNNLDNVFFAFDINDNFNKKFKGENTYTKEEVASNLYGLSSIKYTNRGANMVISGQKLAEEMASVLLRGYPNSDYNHARKEVYPYFESNDNQN